MYEARRLLRLLPGLCFWLLLACFGALWGWEWLLAILLSAAIHEGGHLLTLRLFGAGEGRLFFALTGLEWRQSGGKLLSYGREAVMLLSGPGANILAALLLSRLAFSRAWTDGYFYAGAQLVLGGFNLLPILPLDGGRALYALIAWRSDPFCADRFMKWVSLSAALALLLCAVFLHLRTGSVFLLLGVFGLLTLTLREIGVAKGGANR